MSSDEITRDNHYVPQWYQRGFLRDGQAQLHYLDRYPEQRRLEGGRVVTMRALTKRGPKACFYETDLYSTRFGTRVSDDIEKLLFGPIDDKGALSVKAFVSGDESEVFEAFEDFFEYTDAQRLRTPKGLDWIKSRYSSLDQLHLMREMQALRLMNTMMWMEGVREVVSAEASDVKFIVSDNPVTIFNAACPPGSPETLYPEDPPLEWLGSITVFPLNANTCIIFSHLEYAQSQGRDDLRRPRTNARYRGTGLVRKDAFIRGRKLSRDHVVEINHLLKSTARRFIGAAEPEWLYPENETLGSWQDIASILLPKNDLWKFGGEIFVGYKDGSSKYQDQFGRTSRSHEHLRRKGPPPTPGPNDGCGCGSGQKFKRCCKDVPVDQRPSWGVLSIRERNLILCRALRDILGMEAGKSWLDVRREIDDDQVVRIHELFQFLWPEDTDLKELLPRPKHSVLRSVYLGAADAQTIDAVALGWLPYFDEIVIACPFVNPIRIRPEASPTKSPSQHRAQTLRNAMFMFMAEEYIDAGVLHVVPDVGDFNHDFGISAFRIAQGRARDFDVTGDMGLLGHLKRVESRRIMLQMPEAALRRQLLETRPSATPEEMNAVVAYVRQLAEQDSLLLLQPLGKSGAGGQLMCLKGYNLESALFLASLVGGSIHTDAGAHWDHLHRHAVAANAERQWPMTTQSLARVPFLVQMDTQRRRKAAAEGRLGFAKTILRRAGECLREGETTKVDQQLALQLDALSQRMSTEASRPGEDSSLVAKVVLSARKGGIKTDEVQRLLLSFAMARAPGTVPFAMLMKFDLPAETDDFF